MTEDNNHIDYFELIPKYLSGNASDAEVTLLEAWVLSSPENKAQFNAFKKAWILSGIEGNEQNIDVEEEWQSTAGHLFPEEKIVSLPLKQKRRIGLVYRIAAAVVVLLVASIWIYQLNKGDSLELATENEIEENLLPDGTQLAMNQYSLLTYAPDKDGNTRTVELKGDAFFEVERDTARPFVITAQDIQIEVLGTAFYVDAREDQPQIQVIVQSGSVEVTAGTESVVLTADEIGIYDKNTGELTKKENEDVNYMAWKTDMLEFENTSLETVVFDLNRKFHSKITIANEEIKNCPLNTTFDHRSLDAIVNIIEGTFKGIKIERKGEEIIFSGQGCD